MRIRNLVVRLVLSFVAAISLHPALAQQEVAPSALVGTWTVTEQHPSGVMMTSVVKLAANRQFTTSATVNGKPFMEASGHWQLSGRKLEWRYEQSSHPAIPKGYLDTDTVDSVSPKELKLTSVQSGRKHTYTRTD
jgi:hypothetical protein